MVANSCSKNQKKEGLVMYRVVSASLTMMVLFLGAGALVDAQISLDISGE
jgi:hypothetical protein